MILTEAGRDYLWQEAEFVWDSAEGGKTWDSAAAAHYRLTEERSLVWAEGRRAHTARTDTAVITLRDSAKRCAAPCLAEMLRLTAETAAVLRCRREFAEPIRLLAGMASHNVVRRAEAFGLRDKNTKTVTLAKPTALALTEALTRRSAVQRCWAEGLRTEEGASRQVGCALGEAVGTEEVFALPMAGILSDLMLTPTMTDAAWQDFIRTPSGYGPFRRFEVGEYEYEDALVRLRLERGAAGAEPLLYDAAVRVDIEDVCDRGTAVIDRTDAPTKVYFSKSYYHPPQVSVTLLGASGEVPTPRIVSIGATDDEGRYFETELLRADGSRTSGSVSWSAWGY